MSLAFRPASSLFSCLFRSRLARAACFGFLAGWCFSVDARGGAPCGGTVVDFEDDPSSGGSITCPGDPNCFPSHHAWLLSKGFDILGSPPGYVFSTFITSGLGSSGNIIGFAEPNYLEAHEGLSVGETLTLDFLAGSPAAGPVRCVAVELQVSPTVSNNNVSSTVTLRAFDAGSFLVASSTISFTGVTNNTITPATITVSTAGYDIVRAELTTSVHAAGGVWLSSVCYASATAPPGPGDALYLCFENNTGQDAADLHAVFAGAGGNLYVDQGTIVAPLCPVASIPSNPPAVTDTVVLDWGVECVGSGFSAAFMVVTENGPLSLVNAWWTNTAGVNIGSADTCGTAAGFGGGGIVGVPPPSPSPPPFWAIKVCTKYYGGQRWYTPWEGLDTCAHRWCYQDSYRCWCRIVFCPFGNRTDRLFELPPWIPVGGWFRCGGTPFRCRFEKNTLIVPELGGNPNVQGRSPDHFPGFDPDRGDPYAPYDAGLDPRYSDDGGTTYREAADFTGTFLMVADSLKIYSYNPGTPPPNGHPNILMAMAPRFSAAASVLSPLIQEVQQVQIAEPSALLASIHSDLIQLQQTFQSIAFELSIPRDTNPVPYQNLHAALSDLADQVQTLPFPRFINGAASLDEAARVARGVDSLVTAGINLDIEGSSFMHLLYNRLPRALAGFAMAMSPHMRVRVSLPGYVQPPGSVDGVRVIVHRTDTRELVEDWRTSLSDFGDFDVPLMVPDGTPLEIWFKLPTHLSRTLAAVASDGLRLTAPPLIPGDANNDNCVNQDDATTVQANLGAGGGLQSTPPSDVNGDGVVNLTDLVIVASHQGQCGSTAIGVPEIPNQSRLALLPPFPNPFADRVVLSFEIPEPGSQVTAQVFDALGRPVHRLLEDFVPGGRYMLTWSGENDRGAPLASGVYYVQFQAAGQIEKRAVTYLRR